MQRRRWESSCLLLNETLKQTAEQCHSSRDFCFGKIVIFITFFAIYTILNDFITILGWVEVVCVCVCLREKEGGERDKKGIAVIVVLVSVIFVLF